MTERRATKTASKKLAGIIDEGLQASGLSAQEAALRCGIDASTMSLIRSAKLGLKKDKAVAFAICCGLAPSRVVDAAGHTLTDSDKEDIAAGMYNMPWEMNQKEFHELLSQLGNRGIRRAHLVALTNDLKFSEAVCYMIRALYRLRQ